MARKSRKRQTVTLPHLHSETAGYIRLSVTGKGGDDSIENQKKVIEAWARENQHPISRWYIDAGWSGRTFYRPMFRELIADIERGEVDCVVVKDLSRLGRDHIAVGYYLEYIFLSGIHSCTFIRT
jgi:site-specific DNA recombinase